MIQKLIFLAFLLISATALCGKKESLPTVWVIKDSLSKSVNKDSVQLVFRVMDNQNLLMLNQHSAVIQVKVNGKTKKYTVTNKKRAFRLSLGQGKHQIALYVNANFEEIHFDRELKGGHYYEVGLNFKGSPGSGQQIMLEKPVIYLYSEKEEVFSLKIKTDAELQFTYPAYENEWKGTSSPNGSIRINESDYPYLFWDAAMPADNLNLNWLQADQIEGTQISGYLSRQLNHLGFNEKEKTDFITYWGPRMQKMNYVQILWFQDEQIDSLASLEITPEFRQNRIYLIFRPLDQPLEQTLELKPNRLKPLDRSGNYLVEWGGIEIQTNL